ncbi:MAG: S-layer homology domain-containing protein [Cyanobacteria bacterium J06639_14]
MLTPRTSNTPNPRSPRDKDEWLAVVVALGFLGGTAGWIFFDGWPSLRVNTVNADLPEIELPTDVRSDNNTIGDLPETADSNGSAIVRSTPQGLTSDDDRSSLAEDPDPNPSTLGQASEPTPRQVAPTDPNNANANANDANPSEDTGDTPPTDASAAEPPTEPEPTDSVEVPAPIVPGDVNTDPLAPVREPLIFSDVPDDYWAKPYIDELTALGILNGFPDGTYRPDRPMTRGELAAQVSQAFEIDRGLPSETFTDTADHWAAETIDEAVTTGFMKGYPNGVFQPDQTVPKAQVLVTLVTGLTLPGASSPETALQAYADQADIPEWAREKVASAIDSNLTLSLPDQTQLRPNDVTTRAEVAALLHSALVRLGKVEPLE